jgi:hypothetical protein
MTYMLTNRISTIAGSTSFYDYITIQEYRMSLIKLQDIEDDLEPDITTIQFGLWTKVRMYSQLI